jgi:hypothetical protein
MVNLLLENLPADILVFTLTDPILTELFVDLSQFKAIFVKQYQQFTKERIQQFEKLR